MQANELDLGVSTGRMWTGRILSGLFAVVMLLDAVTHLLKPAPVIDAFIKLDLPLKFSVPLGVLVLVCLLLYLISRTAIFGALLLTGYLGGAVAIHLRAGDGTFALLFPVLIGALMWVGLVLRQPRLQSCL